MAATLAIIATFAFFAARPSWVLGTSATALEKSVGGGISEGLPCQHLEDSAWECAGPDPQLFGIASYRVTVDTFGCWSATRIGNAGRYGPIAQLSGCVTIFDYI
jgi:hypothetical protein